MNDHRVYLITNTVNGKLYVGKTKNTLEERWRGHKYCAAKGGKYHLHSAIRAYGLDVFDIMVLIDNLSVETANREEIRLIAELGTFKHGYNMTSGGEGVPWTPEIGAKMSASRSGAGNPMYGRSGILNPMYGKRTADDVKAKISIGVKRTRMINGPIVVTEETRQRQVESKTRQFSHVVSLHTRVLQLRAEGMKYDTIAQIMQSELGITRNRKCYAVIVSDHKLGRCRTCKKISEAAIIESLT